MSSIDDESRMKGKEGKLPKNLKPQQFDSNGEKPPTNGDWSPHQNFSDYIMKLNIWINEAQKWERIQSTCFAMNASRLGHSNLFASSIPVTRVNNGPVNPNLAQGTIYRVPKIWKRVAAEVIDCVLLLVFKVVITLALSDFIELRKLEDFESRLFDSEDGVQAMLDLSFEILVIAVIHRAIVCIYETISLSDLAGGATPGKLVMGIQVVACQSLETLRPDIVRVWPNGRISVFNSLVRSLVKNLSVMLFVPACFTVFGSTHNRAAYDVICNCIVVETRPTDRIQADRR